MSQDPLVKEITGNKIIVNKLMKYNLWQEENAE